MLFADVVGFTPLSERFDPETVREIMDGCFEILGREIERYGGTVNTFTGDGLMALFGAPVTHEDHAARAVHAAWGIQQAMADYEETVRRRWDVPFQLRLGLNTGLVVVGAVGEFKMDFTAMGDTVNLAARIQQVAPAGGIWATEATHRAAGAAFGWRPAGRLALKGKSEPVAAYEVTGLGPAQGRFDMVAQRGLTRFVGRDPELGQLLSAWEHAASGNGQVVSVVGEAGLGKSRLLHELKQRLVERDAPFYEGSCFAYGEVTPYLPFLHVLRSVLREEPVDAHLASLKMPSEAALFIHQLLGHPVEDDLFSRLPAAVVRQRTVEALRDLVLAEAAARPVALIVEDVHWIDAASQEVLSGLVEAMPRVPLLLVLVYRPEYLHVWADKAYHAEISLSRLGGASSAAMVRAILAKPYAGRVALERLSPEQSQAMIQDLLGTAAVPRELEELIATRTDGNPLFVEELTRSLLESGDLARRSDGYVLTRPAEALSVPTSVQGVLLERVDRLNPALKTLLQSASVLGHVFTYPLLGAVAQTNGDLDRKLLELEDLEFIYPASLAPEREYSFKHVLTQEAVYDTLLRSQRDAYHEKAGQALEALYPERLEEFYERLAYHYTRTPNTGKALEYLELANRKAARAYAMTEAKSYFDQAMELFEAMPATKATQHRRISLLVNQILVFYFLNQVAKYLELLKQYEALANDQEDLGLVGMFYKHLGQCQLLQGDQRGGMKTLHRAVKASEAGGNVLAAGMAYSMLAWAHFWLAEYDQVYAWQAKALRAFEERFDLTFFMWARTAAGWAQANQGHWREATEECNQALRVADDHHDDSAASFSLCILSYALASQGDVGAAIQHAELASRKAPTPADQIYSQTFLGFALCRAGQAQQGVEALASLGPIYAGAGFIYGCVFNGTYLGEAYWRAGRYEDARQTLENVIKQGERIGMQFFVGSATRLLGEVARHANPTPDGRAGAAAYFERSIASLSEIGADNELALAYAGYGRLCHERGETADARDNLTRALEIFERLGTQLEPGRVRETLRDLA